MLPFLFVSDVFPRCFTGLDPLWDDSTFHEDNLNKNWIICTIDLNIRHPWGSILDHMDLLISITQRQRVSSVAIIDQHYYSSLDLLRQRESNDSYLSHIFVWCLFDLLMRAISASITPSRSVMQKNTFMTVWGRPEPPPPLAVSGPRLMTNLISPPTLP